MTLLVALAAFVAGLIALGSAVYQANGYPEYSTLRTDPQGAKALFESLSRIPKLTVERSYRSRLPETNGAVIIQMGLYPTPFYLTHEKTIQEYERSARAGARIVVVFRAVDPIRAPLAEEPADRNKPGKPLDLVRTESPWKVEIQVREAEPDEELSGAPIRSAASLEVDAASEWSCKAASDEGRCWWAEATFGSGSIVLIMQPYFLTNEGLRQQPDPEAISALIGPCQRVIFDESAVGLRQDGTVGGLMQKYSLGWAAGFLLLAGALFVWRSSAPLLPERGDPADEMSVSGTGAMASLLRQHISNAELMPACESLWRKSLPALPYRHRARASQVEANRLTGDDPVKAYRRLALLISSKDATE
jgi:hypothetical protein